jgi:hypothetical protein
MNKIRHDLPVTLTDGTRMTVVVIVDLLAIAHRMGARALKAKGKRAVAMYGAVDVRI